MSQLIVTVVVGYIYLHTLKLLTGHELFMAVTLLKPESNSGPWNECILFHSWEVCVEKVEMQHLGKEFSKD